MESFFSFITTYILVPTANADFVALNTLLGRINEHIINPLIVILFALAFVYFLFGMFKFFSNKDNTEDLETGKRHMVWGIIGMAIMVSVFGIITFMTSSLGLGNVDPSGSDDVSGLFR